jgi:glycosyltransferase involved in cell wall biosynthesis
VIPVYNEAAAITEAVARARAVVGHLPAGSELVVVDDGSTDGTGEVLEELAEEGAFRLIVHRRNRGYGAAIKSGVAAASHEIVAITDADGTYPAEQLPAMLAEMVAGEARMVVGARRARDTSPERRLPKAVLRLLAQHLTGQPIPDLNSGLRLFRRADVARHAGLLPDGFSFTTTITMALLTEGHHVVFHPIRYRRRVGHSKIRPLRDTANFTLLICRTALAFNPMKVFGPVGLALVAAGMALLAARLFLDRPFGVATTVALLLGGVQVLAMGLLADLINRRR